MSIKDILSFFGIGIGVIALMIISYYVFKLLIFWVVKILEVVGFIAKNLFKALYILLMIALAFIGIVGIAASITTYQDSRWDIWAGIIGLTLLYLGSKGFINFIKNRFEFSWDIPYPSNYTIHTISTDEDYSGWAEAIRIEKQDKFDQEFRAKLDADADARLDSLAKWREERAQMEADIAKANWEAEQEARK